MSGSASHSPIATRQDVGPRFEIEFFFFFVFLPQNYEALRSQLRRLKKKDG